MSIDRELIEKVGNTAYEYERVYHGCSQCTLKALQEHFHLGNGPVFKAASALAGGVGRTGEMCGALLGAIMAIGLVFGREKLEPALGCPGYIQAQLSAGEMIDRFQREVGSIKCREIQTSLFGRSYNLRNPEELEAFLAGGAEEECPKVARTAATLAAEIILKERDRIQG
jgi:C_GCAxxG_C_C family probable redox protein